MGNVQSPNPNNKEIYVKSKRLTNKTCLNKYYKRQNLDLVTKSIHAESTRLANKIVLG